MAASAESSIFADAFWKDTTNITMQITIRIRGRMGQFLFYDDEDQQQMEWTLSLLHDHIRNDQRTHEYCADVNHTRYTRKEVEIDLEPREWTAEQVGEFVCMCYDAYFRRKYNRTGRQSEVH